MNKNQQPLIPCTSIIIPNDYSSVTTTALTTTTASTTTTTTTTTHFLDFRNIEIPQLDLHTLVHIKNPRIVNEKLHFTTNGYNKAVTKMIATHFRHCLSEQHAESCLVALRDANLLRKQDIPYFKLIGKFYQKDWIRLATNATEIPCTCGELSSLLPPVGTVAPNRLQLLMDDLISRQDVSLDLVVQRGWIVETLRVLLAINQLDKICPTRLVRLFMDVSIGNLRLVHVCENPHKGKPSIEILKWIYENITRQEKISQQQQQQQVHNGTSSSNSKCDTICPEQMEIQDLQAFEFECSQGNHITHECNTTFTTVNHTIPTIPTINLCPFPETTHTTTTITATTMFEEKKEEKEKDNVIQQEMQEMEDVIMFFEDEEEEEQQQQQQQQQEQKNKTNDLHETTHCIRNKKTSTNHKLEQFAYRNRFSFPTTTTETTNQNPLPPDSLLPTTTTSVLQTTTTTIPTTLSFDDVVETFRCQTTRVKPPKHQHPNSSISKSK